MTPEVSVVIVTRNRRSWLGECIASVRRQEGVGWEIVVVDDASTDGTSAWLRSLEEAGLRVEILEHPHERVAARNIGLSQALGRYVMFLDDDDWLHPGALRVLARSLDQYGDAVAAVGARRIWFTAEDYQRRDAHPRSLLLRDVFSETLFGWSAISGQNLYRTDVVRKVGGYHEYIPCEDRDLWLRVLVFGKVILCPETVMTYRFHPRQWRPPDLRQIRERVARRAIREMPARSRRGALRLRRSNAFLDQAEDSFTQGRFAAGLLAALRAFATAPRIYFSPLIGEWVLRRLAGRVARRLRPPRNVGSG